ncbi:MAG: CapA family protein [Ignavibacteria bacterium]|nr:CapA family protein [Ignavibacteria bacterium]
MKSLSNLVNKICLFLFTILLSYLFLSCNDKEEEQIQPENFIDSDSVISDSFSFIFVGDIMMGTTYPENTLPPDDGKQLFKDVKEILQDADFTVGNLEGPLLDKGGTPKICNGCVAFRTPTRYARYLKEAGFDFLNLANNHTNDMGLEGKKSTIRTLDSMGIGYFGLKEKPYCDTLYMGKRIVFIGFARNHYLNELSKAVELIKHIDNDSSIIIVSVHAGAEGENATRVNRKREIYMNEDRGNIYEFAHKMIDSGADIVFCHGPHVPRGLELYNDKIIAYSLGNFCTYAKFGLSGYLGLAPILKVFIDKNGKFLSGKIFSCKQIKRGIPTKDKSNACVKLMKKLSELDFPESELIINDNGDLSKGNN